MVNQEEQVVNEQETSNQELVPQPEGETDPDLHQSSPNDQGPESPQAQNSMDQNFITLRASKEKAERQRDELLKRLAATEPKKIEEPVEDLKVAPDDLVEGKHLSQYDRKIKELENQVKAYQEQSTAATVESKLRSQYPDFESVVTPQNVEMLAKTHPEIAQTINSSSDLYNKAVSAYTIIKQLGIKPQNTYDAERTRAHENASKPRPLASVSAQQGDSPLTKANAFANGLTEDLKKQLYKEMMEARR